MANFGSTFSLRVDTNIKPSNQILYYLFFFLKIWLVNKMGGGNPGMKTVNLSLKPPVCCISLAVQL